MQRMTPDCCQSDKLLRQLVGSKIDQFIKGIFKYIQYINRAFNRISMDVAPNF